MKTKKVVKIKPRYRRLKKGEIIRRTDEFRNIDRIAPYVWVTTVCDGHAVGSDMVRDDIVYRRRIRTGKKVK